MNPETRDIQTIIDYCNTILETIEFYGKDEDEFLSNRQFQIVCAFSLEQIGEAVKRLPKELLINYPNVEWRGLSKFRDIIAHRYGSIDLNIVWSTIVEIVPSLLDSCDLILKELNK